ncbi:MAG: hypothetical protein J5988_14590 [Eubacterium sp.]|nr:hypothetical protein [Eubacterium sp.]
MNRKNKIKEAASKMAGILVSAYSFFVMVFAIMFVLVMDVFWPYAVAAVLVCPVWFWLADRLWLHEKPVARWIIRLSAVVIGCLIFSLARQYCPYYRYMDMMAQENMKVYFEEHLQTEDKQFKEVGTITKEEGPIPKGKEEPEYYVVTAEVSYSEKSTGEVKKENISLHFDRYSGQFFESMEKMQQYWVEKSKE